MMTIGWVVLVAAAAPLQQDPRWGAFEGCWVPQVEGAAAFQPHMVCVRQAAEGVVFATYADGQLRSERTLIADGAARPVEEGGCKGAELGRWSADGRRVFVRNDMKCETVTRSTASVLAFVTGESFADVQAVRVGEQASSRTIHYRAVPPSSYPEGFALTDPENLARQTQRLSAAEPLDVEDVVEASEAVDAEAVNALLAARRSGFALDGDRLRRLRDAGVAPSTLDVMVALTYPEQFAVADQPPARDRERRVWQPTRVPAGDPYYDRYYSNYGLYGNLYPYSYYNCLGGYYSSFLCDYRWGGRYWNNYYGGIWVYPSTGQPGQPGNPGSAEHSGSVSSEGYRRGSSPSQGTARPRSSGSGSSGAYPSLYPSSTGASSSSGGSSGSSGSGSSSVGTGGHSAGSSSTSTGQTAKPAGGGGGQ